MGVHIARRNHVIRSLIVVLKYRVCRKTSCASGTQTNKLSGTPRGSLSAGSERKFRHRTPAQRYVENSCRKLQNVVANSSDLSRLRLYFFSSAFYLATLKPLSKALSAKINLICKSPLDFLAFPLQLLQQKATLTPATLMAVLGFTFLPAKGHLTCLA